MFAVLFLAAAFIAGTNFHGSFSWSFPKSKSLSMFLLNGTNPFDGQRHRDYRGSTTFALIDGPETGIATPGPATVIQGPSIASMYYVNEADTVQPTLSGVCNLISPVAVCTLSVWTSTTTDTSDIGSSSGAAGVHASKSDFWTVTNDAIMDFGLSFTSLRFRQLLRRLVPSNIVVFRRTTEQAIVPRTLRLVCREICCAVEPLALSHLSINVATDISSFHPTVDKLKAYAEHRTRATDYVRTVSIYHLSAPPSGWGGTYTSYWSLRSRRQSKDLPVALSAALSELKNVRALSWRVYDETFEAVSKFPTHRRLSKFSFDFANVVANCKELAAVIENSPGLANLSIIMGNFYNAKANMMPTLHNFLPKVMGRPRMRLKSLSLENVPIILDKPTLYHLRSLESLSIHFNLPPSNRDLSFPTIWKTLGMEGIRLKKVNVHILDVEDELFDYLSSYEGIREVIFDSSDLRKSESSTVETDIVATRFFCNVLPNIAGKLEVLHLGGISGDRWCFDKSYGEAILKCTQLKELTVSIDVHSPHSLGVEACLQETAAHLPNLLRLRQQPAASIVLFYILRAVTNSFEDASSQWRMGSWMAWSGPIWLETIVNGGLTVSNNRFLSSMPCFQVIKTRRFE
ncbi:hypothetical protein BDZ97DRAFT_2026722 [Flammula alnicola]|nr:hypothetical protein BDZ97DRAFT_2026722 [Flammula alnicola]